MNQAITHELAFVILLAIFTSCKKEVTPPAAVGPVPSEEQMAWHQMERNAFIHFTINTFIDKEWGYGDESPEIFDPTKINVEQWASVLKETGFKGVILTCKHHDGFCLWPSKYTKHTIANSPYAGGNGDLVKELSNACKKYGLKFGVYLSPWDRNRADYGDSSYVTYYRNQLKEIFTSYGPVFEMWFDGANGGGGYYGGALGNRQIDRKTYYDWPATLHLVQELQPEPKVIFFSDAGPGVRWVGNENGIAGETNWNTITPDTLYAGKAGLENLLGTGSENGSRWIPAEADVSIRPGWFYHPKEDTLVKTPEKLLEIYLTSVGRGSTLLLNIPPDRKGLFHENDIKALREWNALMEKELGTNLATKADVQTSSHRGSSEKFAGNLVTDGDADTYWSTDDEITTGSLEINLGETQKIKYVMLQEYIRLGQRVKAFTIEAWLNGGWQEVARATTVGYKRILKLKKPLSTEKIKINITDSKACPVISNVEVF